VITTSLIDFASVLKRPYPRGLLAPSTIERKARGRRQRKARVQLMRGVSTRSGRLLP
jgi:hypothetical protein